MSSFGLQTSDLDSRFGVSGFRFLVSSYVFQVSGFRFGFRISDFGFRFRISGYELRVSGIGFQISGFGCPVLSHEFQVSVLRFRDSGVRHLSGTPAAHQRDLVSCLGVKNR